MKLETFDFNTLPVRVMTQDGQPWFVAADVCRALDIANSRDALAALDDDEKITVANTDSNPRAGIPHQLSLISESGLYTLIFKSRKPEAKKFRKWVTAEVLPAIRRTGGYALPSDGVELVSLLRFVREVCAGWSLGRQMDFGLVARRYMKSMGVVFHVGEEEGVGRVFMFPRPVLNELREQMLFPVALRNSFAARRLAAA